MIQTIVQSMNSKLFKLIKTNVGKQLNRNLTKQKKPGIEYK